MEAYCGEKSLKVVVCAEFDHRWGIFRDAHYANLKLQIIQNTLGARIK